MELERFFFLDDADRELVARRLGEHNRLSFALQLGRCGPGTFLAESLGVQTPVVDFLTEQLQVLGASVVKVHRAADDAVERHGGDPAVFGYRVFSEAVVAGGPRELLSAWTRTRIEPTPVTAAAGRSGAPI